MASVVTLLQAIASKAWVIMPPAVAGAVLFWVREEGDKALVK